MKKYFKVTIETNDENETFDEDDFTVEESVCNAIENEVQDNIESPIFDCKFNVEEIKNSGLAETIPLMISTDYKERFIAEYKQLKNRLAGLSKMLNKWDKGELSFTPSCRRTIYDLQLKAMMDYKYILDKRAEIESIDLK